LIGLDVDLGQVEAVSSFAGDQVFRISLAECVWYLKLAIAADARRDLQVEVAVLETVRGRGVPVPSISAYDPTGDLAGVPCVLLRDVGGSPLTGVEPEFRLVGAQLRRVHDLALVGFGWLSTEQQLRGEDGNWAETIRRRIAAIRPAVDAGLLAGELVSRLALAIDRRQKLLELPYSRLLHGDVHPRHAYAKAGNISGIID
jgi:Ser/Thr protein kinase RdoA (MazF antagonist)